MIAKFGQAGATANTGSSVDLNPASFTVTAWAKPHSTSAGHQSLITSRDDVSGTTYGYILYNVGGNWEFRTGNDAAASSTTT